MLKGTHRYHSFLLRLWPEQSEGCGPEGWRASLENARTGERLGFSSLEQLFGHLMRLTEEAERGEQPGAEADGAA